MERNSRGGIDGSAGAGGVASTTDTGAGGAASTSDTAAAAGAASTSDTAAAAGAITGEEGATEGGTRPWSSMSSVARAGTGSRGRGKRTGG